MPRTVPTPVSAALGLVPTVLDGVRRLPTRAVQLPVLALSSALTGMDLARREYDELSARGERLVARLRGSSPLEDVEQRVDAAVEGTKAATSLRLATPLAGGADVPEAEQPKGSPTPKASEPDATRVDTAAAPDVVAAVETAAAAVSVPVGLAAGDLALPDYDHLTLGALRGRLRSLDLEQLVTLRAYEKSKADRLPVVTMLDNRIAKLAAGDATPTMTPATAPAAASPATATARPPKKVRTTAAAKNDAPPHTKVRHT